MQKEKFEHDNTPNAGKLMMSLRYSGYDNRMAIADLVDNSIDAEATFIGITILGDLKSGRASVAISDNGNGMTSEVLEQALRLGSLTERNFDSDLGRFGMGLVTGSISIARRVEVYTKTEGSPLLVGIMDLDAMVDTNSFDIYRGGATPEQKEIAESFGLLNQGTVVVLSKCDQLDRLELEEFENKLKNFLGESFRYFVRKGRKITVNGKDVPLIDPMWQDGREVDTYKLESELRFEKELEVKVGNVMESFTVKIYRLPDELSTKEATKLGINQDTQGFYVLRNFRQLARGNDLNRVWKRHNSLNRVRVELLVSGRLDSVMGINYTKHNVNPSDAVLHKLTNEVMPEIDKIRTDSRRNKKKAAAASAELDFTEAEKRISQNSKLLDRAGLGGTKKSATRKSPEGEVEVKAHVRGRVVSTESVRFESADLGPSGPLFRAEKEGNLTIITWNNTHPFFIKVVLEQRDDQELVNSISYLAYALGEANIKYSTPETRDLIEEIIDTMSKNLKTLLD